MVTLAPGKTMQVYVPKEHKEDVEAWIENFKLAREKLEEISGLNRALLREGKLFGGG
jgi:hypothetical protein